MQARASGRAARGLAGVAGRRLLYSDARGCWCAEQGRMSRQRPAEGDLQRWVVYGSGPAVFGGPRRRARREEGDRQAAGSRVATMVVSSGVGVSSRVQRRGGVGCCRGGVALAEARRVPGGLRPDRRTAGVGFADRGGARAEMRWASERGVSGAATSSDERVSCCDGAGGEAGQLRGRTTTGWRRKHRCGGRRGICDWRRGESGSERNSEEDEQYESNQPFYFTFSPLSLSLSHVLTFPFLFFFLQFFLLQKQNLP